VAADMLAGRTALVTGASRGIGAEVARMLSAARVRVALLARNETALGALAEETGGEAFPIACDISDPAAVSTAASRMRAWFGGAPDILINNAGIFRVGPLHEMSAATFIESLQTNLVAQFLVLNAFLAEMRERKSGHVVTIGSVADRAVFPGNGAYSAGKHGLRAMHEVLRAELTGSGVRATLVSPAAVDTDLWEAMDTESGNGPFPSRRSMLDPRDVARAVMYALEQPQTVNVDELRLSRS